MHPQQPHQQQPYPTYPQRVYGQDGYPQHGAWQQPPAGLPANSYPPATDQQQWPPLPPAPIKRRRRAWPWMVSGLIVFFVVIMLFAAAGSRSGSTTASPAGSSGGQTNSQPAAVPAAAPAKAITARDWAKIAKDPNSHVGESIIVYGEVTQFDAATGTDTFRANVDGVKHQVNYGYANYETNTVLISGGADLGDLVEGDLFQAETVVAGSVSYQNTMGGSLTAPKLTVSKVKVIGSTK